MVVVIGLAAWFLSPKGENQTYDLPFLYTTGSPANPSSQRMALYDNTLDGELLAHVGYGQLREQDHVSGLALTSNSAITFLAQWHPLIVPERSDLRMEVEPPQRF